MTVHESQPGESTQEIKKVANFRDRRGHPRHSVECKMTVSSLTGAIRMAGTLVELSAGGCSVKTVERFLAGILVRVEIEFQLRGQFIDEGIGLGKQVAGVEQYHRNAG